MAAKNATKNTPTAEVENDPMKVLADLVAEAEAKHRDKVEDQRAALARAQGKISETEAAAEAAREAVAEILAAWSAGDEKPSAEAHAVALSEVTRGEALEKAAKTRAKRLNDLAEKMTTDPAPARIVCEVLRYAYGEGGPVLIPTCGDIDVSGIELDRPVIIVRATESKGSSGIVSGVVEVVAHRPKWSIGLLESSRISGAAVALGIDMAVVGGRSEDHRETARVILTQGAERTPVIVKDPTERDARGLVQDLARRTLLAQIEHRGAVSLNTHTGGLSTSIGLGADGFGSARAVSRTDEDGVRITEVSGSFAVTGLQYFRGLVPHEVAAHIERQLHGEFVPGLGRVESADIAVGAMERGSAPVKVKATVRSRPSANG